MLFGREGHFRQSPEVNIALKDRKRALSLVLSAVMAAALLSSCSGRTGTTAENTIISDETSSVSAEESVIPGEIVVTTTVGEKQSETETETSAETSAAPAAETEVPDSAQSAAETVTTTPPVTPQTSQTTAGTVVSSVTEPPASVTSDTFSSQVFTHSTENPETAVTAETEEAFVPGDFGDAALRPYSYRFLNDKQLYVYDAVITAINQQKTKVRFSALMEITADDYCDVYQRIYNDECSIFQLDTKMQYAINSNTGIVASANLFYKYSDEEIERMRSEVDAEANRVIAGIGPDMTEYDVVKYFYDYLAGNIIYDDNEGRNCSDIYGVFVDKKAICGGFAKAFAYLCSRVGIEAITITGDADNIPHMWNMVRLDRKWYHIDPTYAVASSRGRSYIRYDYFCVPDEVIARTRVIYEQDYRYPEATSEECNFYVKNDLMAYSWKEVKELLTERILAASAEKAMFAELRCGDQETFDEAVYKLFDPKQAQTIDIMQDACKEAENKFSCKNISYNQDAGTFVIKIFLDYTE